MAELSITMDDSIPQQAGPGAGADELHSAIMNLPCNVPKGYAPGKADEVVYRIGHRDARHAAAELVLSHLAAPLAVEDSRERCASSTYEGPTRFTQEEAAQGNKGIRWVTETYVAGRPTEHDVLEYLEQRGEDAKCGCADCTRRLAAMAAASSGKEN